MLFSTFVIFCRIIYIIYFFGKTDWSQHRRNYVGVRLFFPKAKIREYSFQPYKTHLLTGSRWPTRSSQADPYSTAACLKLCTDPALLPQNSKPFARFWWITGWCGLQKLVPNVSAEVHSPPLHRLSGECLGERGECSGGVGCGFIPRSFPVLYRFFYLFVPVLSIQDIRYIDDS